MKCLKIRMKVIVVNMYTNCIHNCNCLLLKVKLVAFMQTRYQRKKVRRYGRHWNQQHHAVKKGMQKRDQCQFIQIVGLHVVQEQLATDRNCRNLRLKMFKLLHHRVHLLGFNSSVVRWMSLCHLKQHCNNFVGLLSFVL